MEPNEKEIVRSVVRRYLAREEPDLVPELDIAFDAVYRSARNELAALGNGRDEPRLPFGPESLEDSLIVITTAIATLFVQQVLRNGWERAVRFFDELEARLAPHPRRAIVRAIRVEVTITFETARDGGDGTQGASIPAQEPLSPTPAAKPFVGATDTRDFGVQPVDLEIRITTDYSRGATSLHFVLRSPSGKLDFWERQIRGEPIRGRPEDYQATLFETLEKLHKGLDARGDRLGAEEVAKDLEALGQELYHELFPPELKTAYRRIRRRAETVLLVSDEPWIPWEIVKPYDDSDPDDIVDDDFLCCEFQLTRWLAGGRGPVGMIEVTKLAAIEAGSPQGLQPLAHAEDERRFLAELATRHPGVVDLSLDEVTHSRVTELLRGHDLDLLHFVGHGELDAKEANVSSFWLHDGRTLRPRDMYCSS